MDRVAMLILSVSGFYGTIILFAFFFRRRYDELMSSFAVYFALFGFSWAWLIGTDFYALAFNQPLYTGNPFRAITFRVIANLAIYQLVYHLKRPFDRLL